ncbi:YbaB/EbfC family nucleoid-associated protein [Micromonospora sp. NPDC049044]|uniref:YbaB/EbfC family nucleoid-associated protein n=1 Tax=Micromonospora sp. NPDC049044 TaxID=3154827 RepID=UPI0033EB05CE
MTEPGMREALDRARAMQAEVYAIRDRMAEAELVGSAAGGAVRVRVNAVGEYRSVRIDPEVYEAGREEVEEAVLAALRDVTVQLREIGQRRMSDLQDIFDDMAPGLSPPR